MALAVSRVTQAGLQALDPGDLPAARLSQAGVQVLAWDSTAIRASQAGLQVLVVDGMPCRVSQLGLQVLGCESLQGEEVSTCTLLWELRRRDGVVQRFAALDQDVAWGGWVWSAAAPFDVSAAELSRSLAAGQLELSGLLVSGQLAEAALLNGLYDHAAVRVIRVDWAALGRGGQVVLAGQLGTVSAGPQSFAAEVLLPTALLQQPIIETVSPECRVEVFSPRCGLDPAAWTRHATISAVTDAGRFVADDLTEPAGWAAYGRVTVMAGENAGAVREVRRHDAGGAIDLWEPFLAPLVPGTALSIQAGCDKRLASCRDRFGNVANFRGFPHLPGLDALLRYPDNR
jgi:uncharacterized phage protein (TIGR02218 family)